jgi:N6-adenosine-specific RNA methylase IME4
MPRPLDRSWAVAAGMKKYGTIVADPPWNHSRGTSVNLGASDHRGMSGTRAPEVKPLPYETMTIDEIKALPVSELAEARCHLYLWTTNRFLEQSFGVARAWGFKVSSTLVWCKPPVGFTGGHYLSNVEYVQFCCRGESSPHTAVRSRWFQWPRGPRTRERHSQKPEAFMDMVEAVSPSPRLEMFARRQRLGWDTWGNEALNHVGRFEDTA